MTKPFSIRELLARVRAQLRRASKQVIDLESYKFDDIELNFKSYQAKKSGKEIELSPREFEILKYFKQHRTEAVTRDQLLDDVWGYDSYPMTRTLDNHIVKLRQKIEKDILEILSTSSPCTESATNFWLNSHFKAGEPAKFSGNPKLFCGLMIHSIRVHRTDVL